MSEQVGKSAIMFDPHPDDADYWTGGLSLMLRQIGWDVHYVCVGKTSEDTRAQALASAKILDVKRHFLEIELTGNSSMRDQIAAGVRDVMPRIKPTMVFIPAFTDYHQEHVELSRELMPIFRRGMIRGCEYYNYDSHDGADPVEIYIDTSAVFEKSIEALKCHTYFERPPYPPGMNTLTRVKTGRAMMLGTSIPIGCTWYAEGYRPIYGHPREVSTLRLLFPQQFYYRPATWLTSMW